MHIDSSCGCGDKPRAEKMMKPTMKYFKLQVPEYKGNAVLRAQK